jgi:hypothetical protein
MIITIFFIVNNFKFKDKFEEHQEEVLSLAHWRPLSGYFLQCGSLRPCWSNFPLDSVKTVGCVRFGQISWLFHAEGDLEVTIVYLGSS